MQHDQKNLPKRPLTEAERFVLETTGSLPPGPGDGQLQAGDTRRLANSPPIQKQSAFTSVLVLIGVVFIFLLWIGLSINDSWPVSLLSPEPIVTMAEFDNLRNGMSYAQVSQIIGAPGKLTMTSNGMPFRAYTWQNPDRSTVTCQFMNDKLVNRTQFMLPETEE